MVHDGLGHKLINHAFEAAKWQTYRAEMHAGDSIAIFKGISVRDGSHFAVLLDLTDFVHCCVRKSRNIGIFASPFLLALNEIASNLGCMVYEFMT
jgi:hypothetical protein